MSTRPAALIVLAAIVLASIQEPAQAADPGQLDRIAPFEQAYAASFYTFDGCGDGVAGLIYRRALLARFAQCPFAAAARDRFRQHIALQRRKSGELIRQQIQDHGGVPLRLQGMPMTCREQQASATYRSFRDRLEHFAAGTATPESVIPEPCEAGAISPY